MKIQRLTLLFPALTLSVGLASPLAAQKTDRQIDADLEFARALAGRFSYVDLAEGVLAGLESANLAGENAEALSLARCDVYAEGAKREPDAEKRGSLYEKAIDAYEAFMEQHSFSEILPQAQRSYVDLVNNYGRVLELRLDELAGEEAAAVRETMRTTIEGGLQLTGELVEQYDGTDLSQAEKNERWRLMLNRGQMLLTLAKVSESGAYLFGQAEATLEKLGLEAGETSGPGLNAYLLLGKVKAAQGDYSTATDFGDFVVDILVPFTDAGRNERWNDEPFESKVARWKLAELGMKDLIEAYVARGRMQQASERGLHFYNVWKADGMDLSPLGYLSLLAAAEAWLESGGYIGGSTARGNLKWFATEDEMRAGGFSGRNARSALDLALKTAQDVNSENKGNILQVHAQKLISAAVDRPGAKVSPEILFEAAEGDYLAKDYARAVESFKGLLRSLDNQDDATRQEFAPKAYGYIGKSFLRMDRTLEATMAYREAANRGTKGSEALAEAAEGFLRAARALKRTAPTDKLFTELEREAERVVETSGVKNEDLAWTQAERAYAAKDYAGARERYLKIEQNTDNYEKALVKAALCLYKLKDVTKALAEFKDYVENYVEDPANSLTNPVRKVARQEALAQAIYYIGRIAYDAQQWDTAIARLSDYATRFPDQTSYGPNALYMVVMSQLAKNDIAAAEGTSATMQEAYPKSTRTGTGALKIYQAIKAEFERANGEGPAADELKRKMATYLELSNDLASNPAFANMRAASVLWLDLGEWERGEAILRKMLARFGEDAGQASNIRKFVMPDLGRALLEQERVPEAFEILDPLVQDETKKPSSSVVKNWCRAVSGWVRGDESNFVEVPGVGQAEQFDQAIKYLLQLTLAEEAKSEPGEGAWECDWYRLKFQTAYTYYRWGQIDSPRSEWTLKIIDYLAKQLGETLSNVQLTDVGEKCGNEVLRRRFLWLRSKAR